MKGSEWLLRVFWHRGSCGGATWAPGVPLVHACPQSHLTLVGAEVAKSDRGEAGNPQLGFKLVCGALTWRNWLVLFAGRYEPK